MGQVQQMQRKRTAGRKKNKKGCKEYEEDKHWIDRFVLLLIDLLQVLSKNMKKTHRFLYESLWERSRNFLKFSKIS